MTFDKIVEKSKMIAEFMGYTYYNDVWEKRTVHMHLRLGAILSNQKLQFFGYKPGKFFDPANPIVICFDSSMYEGLKIIRVNDSTWDYHTSWNAQIPVWSKLCYLSASIDEKELNSTRHALLVSAYQKAVKDNNQLNGFFAIVEALDTIHQLQLK